MSHTIERHFCMSCESMHWFKTCECDACTSGANEPHAIIVCDSCNSILNDSRARVLLEEKCAAIDDLMEQIATRG
jgi:hypothetical protein